VQILWFLGQVTQLSLKHWTQILEKMFKKNLGLHSWQTSVAEQATQSREHAVQPLLSTKKPGSHLVQRLAPAAQITQLILVHGAQTLEVFKKNLGSHVVQVVPTLQPKQLLVLGTHAY